MKTRPRRAFALLLVLSLLQSILGAVPALADQTETRSTLYLAKMDPRLRPDAKTGGSKPLMVQVACKAGTDLSDYFVKSFTRVTQGIAEDGASLPMLQFTTGQITADKLMKVASLASVTTIYAPGHEPPQPMRMKPRPDVAAIRATLEAKRAGTWDRETSIAAPTDVDPTAWYEKGYGGYEEAWANGFTGEGVNVAVIDTGVDFAHPDLQGTQARVTDITSPYYGWPICFDDRSMVAWAFDTLDHIGNWGWFVDTSYAVTKYPSSPYVLFNDVQYKVPPTSLSGNVRFGYHPDDALANVWGDLVAVLVMDEGRLGTGPGVYDTVYVDVDNDKDFTNDKPCFNGDEISFWDADEDGYADISGGMVYFIADGFNHIPGFDWLWSASTGYIPGAGDLVCFMLNDVTEAGGDHGTLCASNVAGQGIVNGDAPPWKPPYAGPGDGLIQAAGKDARIIAVGNYYQGGFTSDFYSFVGFGIDGSANTRDDQANIITQSYGSGSTDNDGWDGSSRLIDEVTLYSSRLTWLESSGNGAPGMGTVNSPHAATGTYVGASTQYGANAYFDSASSAEQTLYGDVQSWSGRGPSAQGALGVSVVANGAWGMGALALNEWGDGWTSWDVWGGTSRSAPVAGGVMATIYDAYLTAQALDPYEWPLGFYETARDLLMSGSVYNNFPPNMTGAGYVNAALSTNRAGGLRGVWTEPAFWNAGDYEGTEYLNFANLVPQGTSATKAFTLHNSGTEAVTVQISDVHLRGIGAPYVPYVHSFTTVDQSLEENSFAKPDYLFEITDLIPEGTDLMIVRAIYPFEQFDADYVPGEPDTIAPPAESYFRLMAYDWTDVDEDGLLWDDTLGDVPDLVESSEIDEGEYVRYNYGYSTATCQEIGIRDPLNRYHDGIFVGFRHRTLSPQIPTTDISFSLWFYELTDWPMLSTDATDLQIPAGDTAVFTATVTTSAETPLGIYEGHILVQDSVNGHTQAIPVVASVSGDTSAVKVLGGQPPAATPYDNSIMHGLFDWGVSYEDGDWRFYFLNQAEQLTPGSWLLIHSLWDDITPTDIDTLILAPTADYWSSEYPDYFGPYTLGLVGGSTRTGSRPDWLFNTATGGNEEWVSAPLDQGLHGILHHNVLFAGDEFSVPFTTTVGTVSLTPCPVVIPADSPSGTEMQITFRANMNITGGLEGAAYGLSQDLSELALWEAGGSWWWHKDFEVLSAGVLEVALHDAESTVGDTDLYLYKWDEDAEAWDSLGASEGATAEEYIKLVRPEDGLYRVSVLDYDQVPGEQYVNIRRPQGTSIALTNLPAGAIVANTDYTLTLRLEGSFLAGTYQGDFFVGPPAAPTALEVPVSFVSTLEPPPVCLPLIHK